MMTCCFSLLYFFLFFVFCLGRPYGSNEDEDEDDDDDEVLFSKFLLSRYMLHHQTKCNCNIYLYTYNRKIISTFLLVRPHII